MRSSKKEINGVLLRKEIINGTITNYILKTFQVCQTFHALNRKKRKREKETCLPPRGPNTGEIV